MILTVVFAVAAAFSNAVNVLTQHWASIRAPKREKGWHLVSYLLHQPVWMLGWIAALGGFVFQALALHNGQLSVVQPILVTELVFVLVLRRMYVHQEVTRTAWYAVAVVCVSLALFLTVAEPTGGAVNPKTSEWLASLLAFGGGIALFTLGGMRGSPVRRAASYAVAGGLAWALMAVFIKATTDTLATFGFLGMLERWPVYALAVSAAAGTVLEQAALHVGPLSVSQPLLVVINPLASIALSIWLYSEHFTRSPARITVALLSFVVMALGITVLSRAAPQDLTPSASSTPSASAAS